MIAGPEPRYHAVSGHAISISEPGMTCLPFSHSSMMAAASGAYRKMQADPAPLARHWTLLLTALRLAVQSAGVKQKCQDE